MVTCIKVQRDMFIFIFAKLRCLVEELVCPICQAAAGPVPPCPGIASVASRGGQHCLAGNCTLANALWET